MSLHELIVPKEEEEEGLEDVIIPDSRLFRRQQLLFTSRPPLLFDRPTSLLPALAPSEQLPPRTDILSGLVHGLSFGILGEKPDTLGERALSFVGELVSISALSLLTQGIAGAFIRPATQLGKIGLGVATDVATGGTVSLITPQHDPLLPLEFGGIGLIFRIPALYRLLRGVKEIPGTRETTAEVTVAKEVAEPEIVSIVKKEAKPKLEERITKLSEKFNEFKKIEENILSEFDSLIPAESRAEAFKANKKLAKAEIKSLFDRLGNVLTSDEKIATREILSESGILSRREINRIIETQEKLGKLASRDDIIRPPEKFEQELTESRDFLELLRIYTGYGLKFKEDTKKLKETIDKVRDKSQEIYTKLRTNPEKEKILDEIREMLDDIKNNLAESVSPEFLDSPAFKTFTAAVAELTGRGNLTVRQNFAHKFIEEVTANEKNIRYKIYQSLKQISSTVDKDFETKAQEILFQLEQGNTRLLFEHLNDIRPRVGRLLIKAINDADASRISNELATLEKQTLTQLQNPGLTQAERNEILKNFDNAKTQAILDLIASPQRMQAFIDSSQDRNLETLYLLYRTAFGDRFARDKLQWILKTETEDKLLDAATAHTIKTAYKDKIKPPDEGAPPSGSLTKDVKDALGIFMDDLSPLKRQFNSMLYIVESRIRQATSVEEEQVFTQLRDWIGRMKDARLDIRRLHVEEIIPRLNEFRDLIRNVERTFGRAQADAGLMLIDDISRLANELIERGIPRHEVEDIITKKISAQPDGARKIYNKFREIADFSLNLANNSIRKYNELVDAGVIRAKKIPEIERRPGWTPFIYEGNFILRVLDSSGKPVYIDFVKDKEQAIKSLEHFIKQNPKHEGRVFLEPRWSSFRDEAEFMGGLIKDMDLVMGIPMKDVKRLLDTKALRPDTVTQVFFSSLLPRTLSLESRRLETLQALTLNLTASARFASYLRPIREGQILHDLMRKSGLSNYADWIKTYIDDLVGRPRDAERVLDRILGEIVSNMTQVPGVRQALGAFGIKEGSRILRSVSNSLTFAGRLMTIGLNMSTVLINKLLYVTNVVPVIGWRNAAWATRHLGKIWTKKKTEFSDLIRESGIFLTSGGLGMEEILTSPKFIAGRLERFTEKVDNIMMWGFNKSEELVRGATLIGAWRQGKQIANRLARGETPRTWQEKLILDIARSRGLPVDSKEVINAYARRIMEKTNFVYDLADLPEIMRNPLTRPFMQFKTFVIKELEFWMGLRNASRLELVQSLGMFLALGGLAAVPGIETLDWISRLAFGFSPLAWTRKYLPEIFVYGIPAMSGIDISRRINLGNIEWFIDPDNIWGLAPVRFSKALKYYLQGQTDKAKELMLPNFARIIEDAIELLSTGEIRSPFQQSLPVVKIDELTPLEIFFRMLGFPTTRESDFRLEELAARATRDKLTRINAAAMRRIIDAKKRGDHEEASRFMRKFKIDVKQVERVLRERERTRKEYIKQILPNTKEHEFFETYYFNE